MITVCLAVLDGEAGRQKALTTTDKELRPLGWTPDVVEIVAGARNYTRYGFFLRQLFRWVSQLAGGKDLDTSRSYDYTDYDALRRFGSAMAARVAPANTGQPIAGPSAL
jgi:menaquinone-dependent protoporphyrinogen IX oxidase